MKTQKLDCFIELVNGLLLQALLVMIDESSSIQEVSNVGGFQINQAPKNSKRD